MIKSHGYENAKIFLLGDGASEGDVISGYALSGGIEQQLAGMCREAGINYRDTWKSVLIKERTNQQKPDSNKELLKQEYIFQLEEELRVIKPNVIVPLSEIAFHHVTGLNGIRKFRGSLLPARDNLIDNPLRVYPILGPAPYLNEDPKLKFISRLDFNKLSRRYNEAGPIPEIGNIWIAKCAEEIRLFFNRHWEKCEVGVFDIETYADYPTCISFCLDGNEAMTVPLLDKRYSHDIRTLMLYEVVKFLATNKRKANQNIKFDWNKLDRFNILVNNVTDDTMIAAGILYPEFPKNLGFLTSIYTEMPYFKDESGKQWDPYVDGRDRVYLYCAKDSLATHKILKIQKEELAESGQTHIYESTMALMPTYRRMERRGLLIDDERRKKLLAKYDSLFNIQCFKLQRLCGYEINPLSDQQLRKLIYEEMEYKKIRGIKYTEKLHLPGTDEESLELLLWMSSSNNRFDGRTIIKTAIACKKIEKVIEYLETPFHPDGRMRFEYKLVGTETGRTSAGATTDYELYNKGNLLKLRDLGRSPQTISKHGFEIDGEEFGKDYRSIYVPTPGFCFVECDLSQAEARVDAVLAEDYEILKIFDGPVGIHRLTGSWLFGCKPEDIKKGTRQYHDAKTGRHAGERNIKEDRLMMMIHQPLSECVRILKTFHEYQPNIRAVFHRQIQQVLQKERRLVSPNGRIRPFFGRYDSNEINEAISTIPQAVVSDQLKFPLPRIFEECDYAYPLVEAHDGFLAEVPLDKKEAYANVFERHVVTPIDFRKCSLSRDFELTIPMEAEWGMNWQEMEKLEYK